MSQEKDEWSVRLGVRDLGGHLDTSFRGWSATFAARIRLVISRLVCWLHDVRDLRRHLDTTFRGWSATLASRVKLVTSRLVLISVLPLDFHGRPRYWVYVHSGALHGIEASLLALGSLLKLPSAIVRVIWPRRQSLANVGAVLSLLDCPQGCDPANCVVWCRFRMIRRYLAYRPSEIGGVYRLLDMVRDGCPRHGPVHLLVASVTGVGFQWVPHTLGWVRPGLPVLSNLPGPIQHFRAAILDAWRGMVAADLCAREGFCCGPLLSVTGSLQLLNSSHVRERDKALLRGVLVGGVWNGFLLGRVRGQPVPCHFCGAPGNDGRFFGECTFPPLVEIREKS